MLSTEGTVVRYETRMGLDGDVYYYPVVSFHSINGENVQFRVRHGFSKPTKISLGDRVKVKYCEKNPDRAALSSETRQFWTSLLVSGISLAIATVFMLCLKHP
jgi:uncharacterized OB-fold protein